MRGALLASAALFCLAATSGCVGTITGLAGGGDDASDPSNPDTPRNLCTSGDKDIAGPRLLRRLTSAELTASVRDVFALSAADWSGGSLPTDPAGRNGFTNNADRLTVDSGFAGSLLDTSKQIAGLVSQPQKLAQLLPCSEQGGEACARTFLDTVGRRLYRRPLGDAETARYLELYAKISASGAFSDWVYWATVGLLGSPNFVYRSELGEPAGGGYQLTGYEVATALAYDLTGHPPSAALLDRAAAGGLGSPEQIAEAARALALDPATGKPRAELRALLLKFTDQWLGLSPLANLQKSPTDFPDFTDEVRASMKQETDAFVSAIVFEQGGGVKELLTSRVSHVDATLAAYYGWNDTRPDGWGVGLLAQGSILAINAGNTKTSPTQRGKLVRKKLLCYDVPPPPPVVGDLPQPTGNETTRQRYEDIHAGNPSCAGCHSMMDGIGFGFEHLDASGRYRADEDGLTIDDSGYLRGLESSDIAFQGPADLADKLAARPEPYECAAEYMASFAYGLDHHDTPCLVSSLAEDFRAGKLGIVDFYVKLTATRYFTSRVDE
jgi:hypothetical protein